MKYSKFSEVYMNLPRQNKFNVRKRNEIVTECKISTTIFYNWLKGITSIPELAKPIIAKQLNMTVSELFPEAEFKEVVKS